MLTPSAPCPDCHSPASPVIASPCGTCDATGSVPVKTVHGGGHCDVCREYRPIYMLGYSAGDSTRPCPPPPPRSPSALAWAAFGELPYELYLAVVLQREQQRADRRAV
jgi:hypothetical protein